MLHPAAESEINKAREFIKGRLLMRMEDSRSVASWLASQELLMGDITTPDETAARIDAVTSADVVRAAERLLNGTEFRLAVVGPHENPSDFTSALSSP